MKKRIIRNQKGFTLIEIIAVLVILGILAAVAIPKYLDMQEQARMKAASGAIAEVKGRANAAYGTYLLTHNGQSPGSVTDLGVNVTDFADGASADFTLTTSTQASGMLITVTKVQGVTLTGSGATGIWYLPSQTT